MDIVILSRKGMNQRKIAKGLGVAVISRKYQALKVIWLLTVPLFLSYRLIL